MSHLKFTKTINVDGTVYEVGTVVPKASLAKGSVDSLLFTRNAVLCESPYKAPVSISTEATGKGIAGVLAKSAPKPEPLKTSLPPSAKSVKEKSEK
jgi:hypothetical protein